MQRNSYFAASLPNNELLVQQQQQLPAFAEAMGSISQGDHSPNDPEEAEPLVTVLHDYNYIQLECVWRFAVFKKNIHDLERCLEDFLQAARAVGSSSQLISSTYKLQTYLDDLLELFRLKSASIYAPGEGFNNNENLPPILRPNGSTATPNQLPPSDPQVTDFALLLHEISKELHNFLTHLTSIPDFSCTPLTDSIMAFDSWIFFRTGSLNESRTFPHGLGMNRFINEVTLQINQHMTEFGTALSQFVDDGARDIERAQDHSKSQLLAISAVATLLGAIAATAFQYPVGQENRFALNQGARALWVSSLILSIASAINAQLALYSRATMYRSARNALPVFALSFLNYTPLFFLVVAVLAFAIGLVIYTFSSSHGTAVRACTTVFTSFTSVTIIVVMIYELREYWHAPKYPTSGKRTIRLGAAVSVHPPWPQLSEFQHHGIPTGSSLWSPMRGDRSKADEEAQNLPTRGLSNARPFPGFATHPPPTSWLKTSWIKIQAQPFPFSSKIAQAVLNNEQPLHTFDLVDHLTSQEVSGAVQDVMFSPSGMWLAASFSDNLIGIWTVGRPFEWFGKFGITQPGSIKWSPDSNHILSIQDTGVMILSPTEEPQTIMSRSQERFEAVTWLSDGTQFAAAQKNSLYIIARANGETLNTHRITSRPLCLHDIAFLPIVGRSLILAVGFVQEQTHQKGLSTMFFGAPWKAHPIQPEDLKPQSCISVYDTVTQRICAEVPVWGEARYLAVSRSGRLALISYAAPTPPELWEIDILADGSVTLEPSHVYLPVTGNANDGAPAIEFVGQARFGGRSDEYVVVAARSGEVYIWKTGFNHELCHIIKDVRDGGVNQFVTGIGCSSTNKEIKVPKFACGLSEGEVVIWEGTTQDADERSPATVPHNLPAGDMDGTRTEEIADGASSN